MDMCVSLTGILVHRTKYIKYSFFFNVILRNSIVFGMYILKALFTQQKMNRFGDLNACFQIIILDIMIIK